MEPDRLAAFRHLLAAFFADNTDAERMRLWDLQVRHADESPNAADALRLLDAIVADPPPDLIALLEEEGQIGLFHTGPGPGGGKPIRYDFAETVEWLRQRTAELRAAYDARTR